MAGYVESPSFPNAGEGERSTLPSFRSPFLHHPLSFPVNHISFFAMTSGIQWSCECARVWEAGSPWLPGSLPLRGSIRASPLGPGLCFTYSSHFAPFPWSGLVGLASPGGFGSGRSAPGSPPPAGRGSPPFCFCLFFLPFLAFLFCLLVSGHTAVWTEVCPELLLGFGSSFGLSDSAQVKFGSQGAEFARTRKRE